jgi:quercetin dioxygenase-like cupin family protein
VSAFGVNAVVLPAGYDGRPHDHEEQEELSFVHSGTLEMDLGDGTTHRLEPGTFARVDPQTVRLMRNVGDTDAVYVCVGGKDGYVGRDGRLPEGATGRWGPGGAGSG